MSLQQDFDNRLSKVEKQTDVIYQYVLKKTHKVRNVFLFYYIFPIYSSKNDMHSFGGDNTIPHEL